MTRVVVCGYGRFGALYAERCQTHPHITLAGVVDADPEAVRRAELAGLSALPSLADALDAVAPELVIVAAPPYEHAHLAVAAMRAGADVMLAKPGAVGMDDADTICAVAWSLGRRVVVDYTPTESPEWGALLREAHDPIITVRLTRRGWSRRQECGALWDLAPHDVALALSLRPADRVESVTARAWWYAKDDEPVGAWIHLCHNSGRASRIEVDWVGVVPERRVEIVTPYTTHVWDQLAEPITAPDNLTRALDRALAAMGGAPDDTDRLREVTRILDLAEHDIYGRAATA